jgi:DNA-binding NarL/FixJ family response regulator
VVSPFVLAVPSQDEERTDAERNDSENERRMVDRGAQRREQVEHEGQRQRHRDQERSENQSSLGRGQPVRPPRGEADRDQKGESEQQSEKCQTSEIMHFSGRRAWIDQFGSIPCKSARNRISPHIFFVRLQLVETRVVIVEDHPLMLSALRETLEQADGFTVVGTASSGLQLEPLVSRTRPDLVLLDLMLHGLDGLSCLALLREHHPQATVVVLSGLEDDETVEKALVGGATAYMNKSIDPADLPVLLRQALLGNVHFAAPRISRDVVTQATRQSRYDEARGETGLTARELEILEAVARGLSNRAVGGELFLSDQTVKFHLHKIYGKLRVTNRTEAAQTAYRLGLVGNAATAA